jgi:hypothetical protein
MVPLVDNRPGDTHHEYVLNWQCDWYRGYLLEDKAILSAATGFQAISVTTKFACISQSHLTGGTARRPIAICIEYNEEVNQFACRLKVKSSKRQTTQ